MVRKQRRMTVKKNSKKPSARSGGAKRSTIRASAKTSKGKTRPAAKGSRAKSQTDRANTALKTLLKGLKQTEDTE